MPEPTPPIILTDVSTTPTPAPPIILMPPSLTPTTPATPPNLLEKLAGYKTYILVALALLACVLRRFEVLDNNTWLELMGALGFGAAGTLRSALARKGI